MHIYTGIIKGTMNRITNLLVLLIVTSLFLPATAIMYVSGSPENNAAPPSGFTENNTAPPSGYYRRITTAPPSGFTENNAAPPSGSPENNAASPSGFRESNNTGNAQGEDLVNTILTVHNQERAEVGVPPLTWSDKLAADSQTWANQMETTGEFAHSTCCGAFRDYGEALAGIYNTTSAGIVEGQARWIGEKNDPGITAARSSRHRTERCSRSLHADGLADHDRGRLRDRQSVRTAVRGSGVPIPRRATSLGSRRIRRASFLSR